MLALLWVRVDLHQLRVVPIEQADAVSEASGVREVDGLFDAAQVEPLPGVGGDTDVVVQYRVEGIDVERNRMGTLIAGYVEAHDLGVLMGKTLGQFAHLLHEELGDEALLAPLLAFGLGADHHRSSSRMAVAGT